MNLRQGICVNTKACPLARRSEKFSMGSGDIFECPVCGHALEPLETAPLEAPVFVTPEPIGPLATEPVKPVAPIATQPVPPAAAKPIPQKARFHGSRIAIAIVLIVLLGGLAAHGRWPNLFGPSHADAKDTILRLAGSNTIGESLGPALAEAFLKSRDATNVHRIPGDKPDEVFVAGTLPGNSSPSYISIAAHGSATAFTTLAQNGCDIGMASRRIKPDEVAKLSQLGDMSSPASEHVLALDGIAVVVNASNSMRELTKSDIKRIFTGELTTWPNGSPSQGPIEIYARDDKSGTFDTFKALVLEGKPLASTAHRFEDSNALSSAVSSRPNSIGFIGLPFIHSARAVAVSDKQTQALLPTLLTVATEDYLLSRRLYLYTAGNPANAYTRQFVEFALSAAGQEIVSANGFVAQNLSAVNQTVSADAPQEYRELTRNAQRLSVDFRFVNGEARPDNKALMDLDRVVSKIAGQQVSGDKIMLFGFADNIGNAESNKELSLQRADFVDSELKRRGLHPTVIRGFGAAVPVATNDTADGRQKNRRVELWIKN